MPDDGVASFSSAADQRVSADAEGSSHPSLVPTDEGYALAWSGAAAWGSTVRFRRLSAAGAPLGDVAQLSAADTSAAAPSLARDAAGLAAAWQVDGQPWLVQAARLAADGSLVGGRVEVAQAGALPPEPVLVRASAGWGLAWRDTREGAAGAIWFAAASPDLAQIGAPARVSTGEVAAFEPALVRAGTDFGVAWTQGAVSARRVWFARLDEDGARIGEAVPVSAEASDSHQPALVWTGGGYAVVWSDNRLNHGFELYFRTVSVAGAADAAERRLTASAEATYEATLAWTGAVFGVAYSEIVSGDTAHVRFSRLSPAGVRLGAEVPLVDHNGRARVPALAWAGDHYAWAWQDSRLGNDEVFFRHGPLGCAAALPDIPGG